MSQTDITVGDWFSEGTKERAREFVLFLCRAGMFLPGIFLVLILAVIFIDFPRTQPWRLAVVLGPFVVAILIATAERIAFRDEI